MVGDHRRGCVVWGCEGKGQAAADELFEALDPPPEPAGPEHAKRALQPPEPAMMVPFGPCPTVPAGDGIRGAWLEPGLELDPCLFARASRLTAVSMDMTGGYAKSVRANAPQATVVIDNYHVVQLATKALDEVRREHWNELRRAGETGAANQFKHDRWALLKNPDDLSDRQAATLAALQAAGGKIPRAWALKETVRAIFAPGLTVAAVAELIDRLLARLSRSRLKPLVWLGRTIRKHRWFASDFAIEIRLVSDRILGCFGAPDRGGLTDAGRDAAAAQAAVAGGEVAAVLGGHLAGAHAGGRGAQVGCRVSVVIRLRRLAKDAALAAFAASRPGRVLSPEQVELEELRQENARLSEALKELAVELSLVRGRQRSGFQARSLGA